MLGRVAGSLEVGPYIDIRDYMYGIENSSRKQ